MSKNLGQSETPKAQLAQFIRTDDGLDFLIPDEWIAALGWQDNDLIDLSFEDGKIICRKISGEERQDAS